MSAALVVGIGLLGGLGAVSRFLLDHAVSSRAGRGFPWGTLAVNVSGAFALGVLVGAAVDGGAFRLAATGFLGAYTTFSAWALESHRLGQEGRPHVGAANFAVSLVLGLAAWVGRELGGWL